jgi:hypothetical protein
MATYTDDQLRARLAVFEDLERDDPMYRFAADMAREVLALRADIRHAKGGLKAVHAIAGRGLREEISTDLTLATVRDWTHSTLLDLSDRTRPRVLQGDAP